MSKKDKTPNKSLIEFEKIIDLGGANVWQAGRTILFKNQNTEEEQAIALQHYANQVDNLQEDIEGLVQQLEEQILAHNPLDIIAHIALENAIINPETYKEYKHHGNPAYVEYLTLVCLTHDLNNFDLTSIDVVLKGNTISEIQEKIQKLFTLQMLYIRWNEVKRNKGVPSSERLTDLRVKILGWSLVVRFPAYHHHYEALLRELLSPLDDLLLKTLGFTINTAIQVADFIDHLISTRLIERREEAKVFQKKLKKAVKRYRQKGRISDEFPEEVLKDFASVKPSESKAWIENVCVSWVFNSLGQIFSFTISDVAENKNLPLVEIEAFLNCLSLQFGQVDKRYRNPSPTHPLMQSPFINIENQYFCPVVQRIIWSILPTIESHLNPDLQKSEAIERKSWDQFTKLRGKFLEAKSVELLATALQNTKSYINLKYGQDEELDGLIIFDSVLLLIQAKSGTLSPPARRGAPKRIKNNLGRLVDDAFEQGERAKAYIENNDSPVFRKLNGKQIVIDKLQIQRIVVITVTLEHLGAFITNIYQLKEIGLLAGDKMPWAISLTDLQVICELVDYPCQLIHYFERRNRINDQRFVEAGTELDLFGHYLTEGLWFDGSDADLSFDGDLEPTKTIIQLGRFSSTIDDYYMYVTEQRQTKVEKPTQYMPEAFRQVLSELNAINKPGYIEASLLLLEMNGLVRDQFCEMLHQIRKSSLKNKRFHDFTIPFRMFTGDGFGVTVISAPQEKSLDLISKLNFYCTLKKYQTRSKKWLGLGTVGGQSRLVYCFIVLSGKWELDSEMEQIVKDTLPPLKSS